MTSRPSRPLPPPVRPTRPSPSATPQPRSTLGELANEYTSLAGEILDVEHRINNIIGLLFSEARPTAEEGRPTGSCVAGLLATSLAVSKESLSRTRELLVVIEREVGEPK